MAHELTLTRIFDAPRELVFRTWLEPRYLAQWWGPKDFTNPVCEVDARPGGAIYIEMTAPDGTPFPTRGMFREIVEPERIVLTTTAFDDGMGTPGLEGLNTVTFEDYGGKTKLTLHVEIIRALPEVAASLASMDEGWNQSLDRLAATLKTER